MFLAFGFIMGRLIYWKIYKTSVPTVLRTKKMISLLNRLIVKTVCFVAKCIARFMLTLNVLQYM